MLHLTTELVTTRNVSAELFDQVHTALDSEATVEVLMIIARYSGLALMLNALDVDLDEPPGCRSRRTEGGGGGGGGGGGREEAVRREGPGRKQRAERLTW